MGSELIPVAIILSDWLDGRTARAMNQTGRTRMYLDAWVDFAVYIALFAVLAAATPRIW